MTNDYILYVGESRDFSDHWLTKVIGKQTKLPVIVLKPDIRNIGIPHLPVLAVNRLYTSAVGRYGNYNMMKSIKKLISLEKKKVPLINSSRGYLMDLDRNQQFVFFKKHNLPYIQTSRVTSVLQGREAIIFPCVLKSNPSGRNKTLKIINDRKELSLIPDTVRRKGILQPLIKDTVCYRTEFVGNWHATYPQQVYFQKNKLTFHKIYKIIPSPLSRSLRQRVVKLMNDIKIYAFSIEYFQEGKRLNHIVDFNFTSNYHPTFIKKTNGQLEKSWQKLIKEKL